MLHHQQSRFERGHSKLGSQFNVHSEEFQQDVNLHSLSNRTNLHQYEISWVYVKLLIYFALILVVTRRDLE